MERWDESPKKSYETALEPGTVLAGRFLVERVLGYGGFGITYIGADRLENRRVVIKECFHYNLCRRGEDGKWVEPVSELGRSEVLETQDRFMKEVSLMQDNADNPGIVQIYLMFHENNTVYYAMEYLEGQDLKQYLKAKGGILSWQETQKLLEPIFTALISLHRFNIWHRDISPDNIFVCDDGKVRLIDFGSARTGETGKSRILDVAKQGYAPVEQYNEKMPQGTWTDVYAMAATVYRCITGIVPPPAVERLHRDTCQSPSKYVFGLPGYVDQALMKGLAVQPQHRFYTMAELMAELYQEVKTASLADRVVEEAFAPLPQQECHVRLQGLDGYYEGCEIPIEGKIIMGRRRELCNVVFPENEPGVSGVHCSIHWNEQKKLCVLRDNNSTYGTRNLGGKLFEQGRDIYLDEGEGFIIGEDNVFVVLF